MFLLDLRNGSGDWSSAHLLNQVTGTNVQDITITDSIMTAWHDNSTT
jgi:hypothetical protein